MVGPNLLLIGLLCDVTNLSDLVVFFRIFPKLVTTAVPADGRPPGALVLAKLVEWYRFEVGQKNVFCFDFCGLQKSRHLPKSRVTERHNRGTQRKWKSHQGQKKALRGFLFGWGVRL